MSDDDDDDDLMSRLGDALGPAVPPVDPARLAAIRAQASASSTAPPVDPTGDAADATGEPGPDTGDGRAASPSRRSLLTFGAVAAGGIAAGVAGAVLLTEDPAPGPPLETAAVRATDGVEATATMIDHTWGLEVLLDTTGLVAGERYAMSFEATDGRVVDAGGFVGISGLMRCRNNGALLRAETARWFVTSADGTEIISADLD